MKKFFFFDIDGTLTTLLTSKVPDSTRECLYQLEKRGHFVAIATGRLQISGWEIAEPLGIPNMVADGGYSLTIDGQVLYHRGLDQKKVHDYLTYLEERDIPFAVTTTNELRRYTRDERYLEKVQERYYRTTVDPTFDWRDKTIYKIFVVATTEAEKTMDLHGLDSVRYFDDSILIEPMEKDKGIRDMLRHIHGCVEDVVVFGDGSNDMQMFDPVWFSIAMGNAYEPLKKKANYITDRCEQDGVWKACKKFGWIE